MPMQKANVLTHFKNSVTVCPPPPKKCISVISSVFPPSRPPCFKWFLIHFLILSCPFAKNTFWWIVFAVIPLTFLQVFKPLLAQHHPLLPPLPPVSQTTLLHPPAKSHVTTFLCCCLSSQLQSHPRESKRNQIPS